MNPTSPPGSQSSFFGQKVSIPGINVNDASDNQLILKDDYTTRIYYVNGIPNIILGQRPSTGEEGLFIAQPGIDVTQAVNTQLGFNSSQSFTVALQGSVAFESLGTTANNTITPDNTIPIPHGLGFVPSVNCFMSPESAGITLPGYPNNFPQDIPTLITSGALQFQGPTTYTQVYYGVDEQNFYIGQVFTNESGSTQTQIPPTVYYVVFTLNTGNTV